MNSSELTRGIGIVGALLMKINGGASITPFAGVPVSGGSGTFATTVLAKPGSLLINTTNGALYINIGTQASPTWSQVGGSFGGASGIQTAILDIPNAQIKTLRATPQTIVASPGAGFVLVPVSVVSFLKYGGTNAFTAAANDNLAIKRDNGSGAVLTQGMNQTLLQGTASAMSEWIWPTSSSNEAKAVVDNQPLVVHNITASEIAGNAANDNLIRVVCAYQVIPANGW